MPRENYMKGSVCTCNCVRMHTHTDTYIQTRILYIYIYKKILFIENTILYTIHYVIHTVCNIYRRASVYT